MINHCLLNLSTPGDISSCFATSSNQVIFGLIFFALVVIVCGGWSLTLGISKGLAVGGFLMSLIGIVAFIYGYINIVPTMFAIMLTTIGALILVIEQGKGG